MIIWLITLVFDSIRAKKEARKEREAREARQLKPSAELSKTLVNHQNATKLDQASALPLSSANVPRLTKNRNDGTWQKLE